MRRIGVGSDDDEIVVHHVAAVDAKTVGDKLVLADAIVNQQRIGVAARADRKRLAGADRDDVHAQAGRARKIGRMCSNRPESWVEVVELRTMKRSSAWAVVTIRADKSRVKIRIISVFLARTRRQCNPVTRPLVKFAPRALLSIFSLRRRRATLVVLITDCERGMVEKA